MEIRGSWVRLPRETDFITLYLESKNLRLQWGYFEKMVRKEILRARAIPRDALLETVNNQEKQSKITFNIT